MIRSRWFTASYFGIPGANKTAKTHSIVPKGSRQKISN